MKLFIFTLLTAAVAAQSSSAAAPFAPASSGAVSSNAANPSSAAPAGSSSNPGFAPISSSALAGTGKTIKGTGGQTIKVHNGHTVSNGIPLTGNSPTSGNMAMMTAVPAFGGIVGLGIAAAGAMI